MKAKFYILIMVVVISYDLTLAQEVLTIPKTLLKRCKNHEDSTSCYELGMLYYRTKLAEDKQYGSKYLQLGCNIEMSRKCSLEESLSRAKKVLETQRQLDEDIQKERVEVTEGNMSTDEISCWEGSSKACDKEATYQLFLAQPVNPKKARQLFKEGCDLGNEKSCATLKLMKKGIIKVFNVEM